MLKDWTRGSLASWLVSLMQRKGTGQARPVSAALAQPPRNAGPSTRVASATSAEDDGAIFVANIRDGTLLDASTALGQVGGDVVQVILGVLADEFLVGVT